MQSRVTHKAKYSAIQMDKNERNSCTRYYQHTNIQCEIKYILNLVPRNGCWVILKKTLQGDIFGRFVNLIMGYKPILQLNSK